jgi:hypothetical protein
VGYKSLGLLHSGKSEQLHLIRRSEWPKELYTNLRNTLRVALVIPDPHDPILDLAKRRLPRIARVNKGNNPRNHRSIDVGASLYHGIHRGSYVDVLNGDIANLDVHEPVPYRLPGGTGGASDAGGKQCRRERCCQKSLDSHVAFSIPAGIFKPWLPDALPMQPRWTGGSVPLSALRYKNITGTLTSKKCATFLAYNLQPGLSSEKRIIFRTDSGRSAFKRES